MKKTEISISMPIIYYEELVSIKTKYKNLISEIQSCFDTQNFDSYGIVDFNVNKILDIAKSHLSTKYNTANYNIITTPVS